MISPGGVEVVYRLYTSEQTVWILMSCFPPNEIFSIPAQSAGQAQFCRFMRFNARSRNKTQTLHSNSFSLFRYLFLISKDLRIVTIYNKGKRWKDLRFI